MRILDKVKGCIVLKEGSCADAEISELRALLNKCDDGKKAQIESAIKNLEYGKIGENAILFELKNSGFPMLVLQDLYLEFDGLSAQIDFMILTRDKSYIIECKNMYGDIVVNDSGEFMRKINGRTQKIYSPVTQCERHVQLIKQIRYDAKSNFFTKLMFEKYGNAGYKPLIVMANPTGKINTKYAPKDMKKIIIGVDQLVRYIKQNHQKDDEGLESQMLELGDFFLKAQKTNPQNYMEKYRKLEKLDDSRVDKLLNNTDTAVSTSDNTNDVIICSRCGSEMVLRTAKRGDNAGNNFYGCSNYPKCRNIVNIESK